MLEVTQEENIIVSTFFMKLGGHVQNLADSLRRPIELFNKSTSVSCISTIPLESVLIAGTPPSIKASCRPGEWMGRGKNLYILLNWCDWWKFQMWWQFFWL